MGRFIEVMLHPNRRAYRKINCLTWIDFDCSLDELEESLKEEYNRDFIEHINEPNISDEFRQKRLESYERNKIERIHFYIEERSPFIF